MSDIKKFNGYVSSDGTPHKTQALAVKHEQAQKVNAAVEKAFGGFVISPSVNGTATAAPTPLPAFILAQREVILAALNPEVLLRKKRVTKPKTAPTPSTEGAAA